MRTTDMADELFSGAAQPLPAGVRLATARHGGVTVTRVEIAREGLSRPRAKGIGGDAAVAHSQYFATAMSHDELEFLLPAPVSEEKAMDAAVELYGFCPDVIDQGPEDATVGALADVLRQSTVWYFWWD